MAGNNPNAFLIDEVIDMYGDALFALQDDKYEGEARHTVGQKKKIEWVVVAEGLMSIPFNTRSEARAVVRYDKIGGVKSHIERREYVLVDSKKVS